MRVFRGVEEVPAGFGPSAVTVGKFDGVHTGHRAVIADLLARARERGLAAVAVTFDRHPFEFHRPDAVPPALLGLDRRLELLEAAGLDATVVLRYDEALAAQTPEEFVERVFVGALGARLVSVGLDFRFGRNNAGSVETLRGLGERDGFAVRIVDDVLTGAERRVSSTWIRRLLAEGDVREAGLLLGRPPEVRGRVVHGARRGRELGFPTANLAPDARGFVPADGVYAGTLLDDGALYPAAVSVGDNPTFEGVPRRQVEAHVLGRELDLYDRTVDVAFLERIRGMVAFEGVPALVARMREDVAVAAEIVEREAGVR